MVAGEETDLRFGDWLRVAVCQAWENLQFR